MTDAITPEAIKLANEITKFSRNAPRAQAAVISERYIAANAIYLGAAIGCQETAEILYRLADFFAVQKATTP